MILIMPMCKNSSNSNNTTSVLRLTVKYKKFKFDIDPPHSSADDNVKQFKIILIIFTFTLIFHIKLLRK